MAQITLKDIARKLGISTSTVSRALSDHPAIKEETRIAVQKLAESLDYKPNALAFNLKKRRTSTIGIIVPELAHHYFSYIISGIQEELYKEGYNILICQSNDNQKIENQLLNMLMANQVDGLLVSIAKEVTDYSHYARIIEKETPLVFFDRVCEGLKDMASSVTLDDYNGSLMATNALIKEGCKKLAIIAAPQSLNIGKERLRGFEDALKFAGMELNPSMVVASDFTVQVSKSLTYQLLALKNRPDGILVASGLATLGCMAALREMGYEPGKEIKVAGFLGDLYPGHTEHGLIRVFPPTHELGRQAAKLLLERIKTPEKPVQHLELDVKLIID